MYVLGLPRWFSGNESVCPCRRLRLDPADNVMLGIGKMTRNRKQDKDISRE